ncbi:MAG TPA: hypothetical protein VLM80_08110 [Anaerolineales bacterium]|nr:hypothetical protein [Anaerolineales bacterium]
MDNPNRINDDKKHERIKNLPMAVLIGCIGTLPALLFLTFIVLSFKNEYYFPSYLAMGVFFFVASFLSGAFVTYWFMNRVSHRRLAFYLFLGSAIAWIISLVILGILSLTPLCIGQDNGDGSNDLFLCVIQVVLVSLSYSPFALLMIAITSFVASRLLPNK